MATSSITGVYGRGKPAGFGRWHQLPDNDPSLLTHPGGYLPLPGLVAAVNVALELGMPLLLTGEPGCGKSQLAYSLAYELDLPRAPGDDWARPLVFTVKSDSRSRDLFFGFDALGPLRPAPGEGGAGNPPPRLRFEALGLAILLALGPERIRALSLADCLDHLPAEPQRSVILIDEIDNAPAEVADDILSELDRMGFEIPAHCGRGQAGARVELKRRRKTPEESLLWPIVVITSNRKHTLSEGFLRRCVYFHLDLPQFRPTAMSRRDDDGDGVDIESIVERRLRIEIPRETGKANAGRTVYSAGISFFRHLREQGGLQKPPSVAELLGWMRFLRIRLGEAPPTVNAVLPLFRASAAVTLFKHKEDQDRAARLLDDWLTRPAG